MNYLLINHIAANPGRDAAHLRLPPAWARDLAAAGRAAQAAGVRLTVATPIVDRPAAIDGVEVVPDASGFEHIAIPSYDSARSFLAQRGPLETALAPLIASVDVVQLDHGGHPVPLGLVAQPLAREAGKPVLWMLPGDRWPESHLNRSARTAAKRAIGRGVDTRIRQSLIEALTSANAVVTTTQAGTEQARLRGVEPTLLETLDLDDADVADETTSSARQRALLEQTGPLRLAITGDVTVDRGVDHVLAAMHRCWRLRVPVAVTIVGQGVELPTLQKRASELGLAHAVAATTDATRLADAHVLVDAALTNLARVDLTRPLASGLAPIAYSSRLPAESGVLNIPRGDVDALAEAIFRSAVDRTSLCARMLSGIAWSRARTTDAGYRRRFEVARGLMGRHYPPAQAQPAA